MHMGAVYVSISKHEADCGLSTLHHTSQRLISLMVTLPPGKGAVLSGAEMNTMSLSPVVSICGFPVS